MLKIPDKVLPGTKLASIEEFEGGQGTYTRDDYVRALFLGRAQYDMKARKVTIQPVKTRSMIPSQGDSVTGTVEVAHSSMLSLKILSINGKDSAAGFTGLLFLNIQRGRGRRPIIGKYSDLVRATVVSNRNGIIQLALEGKDDGVLSAVCSSCGSKVSRHGTRIKCSFCGLLEERGLSPDFEA